MSTGSQTIGDGGISTGKRHQLWKFWVVDQCINSGKPVRLLACTVPGRCELAERSLGRNVAHAGCTLACHIFDQRHTAFAQSAHCKGDISSG